MAFKRSFNMDDIAQAKKPKRESKFNSFLRGYQTSKSLVSDVFSEQIAQKKADKQYQRDKTLYEELEASGKYDVGTVSVDQYGNLKKTYKAKPTMQEQEMEQLKIEKMKADTKYSTERADAYKQFKESQIAKNEAQTNKAKKGQTLTDETFKNIQAYTDRIRKEFLTAKDVGAELSIWAGSDPKKIKEAQERFNKLVNEGVISLEKEL
jgi:hypothetical protein